MSPYPAMKDLLPLVIVHRKTSIKRWVPNNRRVSNKRRGSEARVLNKRRVSNKQQPRQQFLLAKEI